MVTDAQAEIHQRPDAKKFILILPEGETSELALLFADYLVRSQGHRSLYLGAGLPGPDLHTACRNYKPDFVICTLSGLPLTPEAYKSLEAIHAAFPEAHTLATGFKLCGCLPLPAENFSLLENFDMLGELLELGGAQ